jgi:hypothetical protein
MSVVLCQVLAQPGDFGVHLGAAQILVAGVFADGRLHQWRAGQVDAAAATHQNHVVRQARQVGTPGGGRAVHHRQLRDASGREPRLIGERAAPLDEDLGLVHQVRAAAFHQRDQRQLVLAGQLLRAQRLLQAHRRHGAALDRAVGSADQHALAGHGADAHDAAATHHALLAVVVVHAQTGQWAELQEVAAAVQQPRHAFARQQLAAVLELAALALAFAHHLRLQCLHLGQPFAQALRIGGKRGRPGVQLGGELRHGRVGVTP